MNPPRSDLDVVGKVADSFLARYRRGERPPLSEYTAQYPDLADEIRELFPALVVMEELGSSAEYRMLASARVPDYLGDYRIVRELGRGGMGVVYEAVQESLGRHVALKVFSLHSLVDATHLERFRREARAAAGLHHTNIVPVYGVGECEGVHYYAMQFIHGQPLDQVLKDVRRLRGRGQPPTAAGPSPSLADGMLAGRFAPAGLSACTTKASPSPLAPPGKRGWGEGADGVPADTTPLPVAPADAASTAAGCASATVLTGRPEAEYYRSVARMGVQVAAALDYAHRQGVLHRDIKPSNLLLDARGTVWVTDFGLAKAEGADELTRTGDIVGTLRYMAPERFDGGSDPRGDVYGLGVTLYEMLTLCPAYDDSDRARLVERVTREDPRPPRAVDRSIPRDLETIVLKAIAKEPGRRYQTAAEVAEDLGRFLAGEPVRARRIGLWERAVKWVRRRPALAALLAVSAAAALALVAGVLVHSHQLATALGAAHDNLGKAQRAEREMHRQLATAQLRQAQARRTSGLPGQRYESLEALKLAAAHFRTLGTLDEERTLELRNEVIACLTLADAPPARERPADPGWTRPTAFDPTLEHYVVRSVASDQPERQAPGAGDLSVRRATDDHEVARLPGFGVRAVGTRFSPDGRYLAAHYEWGGRSMYIWDVARGEAVLKVSQGTFEGFPAFSPDSRLVAIPRPDRSIEVYELPSGARRNVLPPGPPVSLVQIHPDGRRLAVASDKTVYVRDLNDGKELAAFKHPAGVHSLAWRGDGRAFAAGCFDHDIYLWDVANSAQPLRTLKGHMGSVFYVAFSPGGELLASDAWDSTCRLWDAMTGQQLLRMPGDSSLEFGPDGEGIDHAWRQAGGPAYRTFHGRKHLTRVAVSPKGRFMASVGADGVELWDLAARREGDKHLEFLAVGGSLSVHFSPDGGSLITDGNRAGLQRWPITPDPATGGWQVGPPESLGLSGRAPFVAADPDFALSADGRAVAYCPQFGQAFLYDVRDPRRKLLMESPRLRHAAFSPDGRWLATGNWQGRGAKVWDARTGAAVKDLDLFEPEQGAAWPAFSPDGRWLVVGTFGEYRFWEVGTWQKKHALPRAPASRNRSGAAFTPDGKVVAVLHGIGDVRLVDPATGREFARLPDAGCPHGFSPDGSQLVTHGVSEGAFRVWDLRLIRRHLKDMGLDWDLPSYAAPPPEPAGALRVRVVKATKPAPSAELDAQAHLDRGLLGVRLRRYAAAADDFKRADRLAPQRISWEEVAHAYSEVIERHSEDAEAYHQRAHAHGRLGQWDKAVADYTRAISLAPQSPDLLACRGRAYRQLGQTDKAAEDFRKAGEQKAELANRLAWELVTSPKPGPRDPVQARELARRAVRQAPREAAYWTTLGVAHYRTGDWPEAVKALEEAEKLAPGKGFGLNGFVLALCHHQLGDVAKAREHFDRAARWCEDCRHRLSDAERRDLRAFQAEAEAVLKIVSPGR